jgi:hypothetical protein
MDYQKLIDENDAFIFELENVIFPKKDFLLQVYYLFAQFIEYAEQIDSVPILDYMKQEYERSGSQNIFDKTASQFNLDEKYKVNFNLLLTNARLPLKLLIFPECLKFLALIVASGKQIFLLVSGNPEAQLNKIRQVQWEGFEYNLVVYFKEEVRTSSEDNGLPYVIDTLNLRGRNILMILDVKEENNVDFQANVNFAFASKLFPIE